MDQKIGPLTLGQLRRIKAVEMKLLDYRLAMFIFSMTKNATKTFVKNYIRETINTYRSNSHDYVLRMPNTDFTREY